MTVLIRPFDPKDAPELARIWFDGWHGSHPELVPEALTRLRTFDSFLERLTHHNGGGATALQGENPVGFCLWRDQELYQLFVDPIARGTGTAQQLVEACLASFRHRGVSTVHLDCAVGNKRAMAFYEKFGFINKGPFDTMLDTSEGPFTLECLLYEIELG